MLTKVALHTVANEKNNIIETSNRMPKSRTTRELFLGLDIHHREKYVIVLYASITFSLDSEYE